MTRLTLVWLTMFLCCCARASTPVTNSAIHDVDLLLVIGAPGEPEFEREFAQSSEAWSKACEQSRRSFLILDARSGETNQLEQFRGVITNQTASLRELWIVFIGHGTFDGKEAKFNMAGPDLSATDAAKLLEPLPRPLVFINTTSSSAPFLPALSRTNRIVITGTKSGYEENYARFGLHLSQSIYDLAADLDKDAQVSLLEAFLAASRRTEGFYQAEKRLATEHALLDDNGDGKGTPASFFKGVRAAKKADDDTAVDGFRAHQIQFLASEAEAALSPEQRQQRNLLEQRLEQLRARKKDVSEAAYLDLIEPLLLELSRLYEQATSTNSPAR